MLNGRKGWGTGGRALTYHVTHVAAVEDGQEPRIGFVTVPTDLAGLSVIETWDHCTIREHALQALADHRIPSTLVCEAGHLAGVVNATRAGLGVALLAHVGRAPEDLVPRPDLPAVADQPIHVRTRRRAPRNLGTTIADGVLASHHLRVASMQLAAS